MRGYVLFLTVLYCCAFGVLGSLIASLGPVLPELAAQVGVGVAGTGPAWLARSAGYLAGSFSGPLYDQPWITPNFFTGIAVAVAGIGAAMVPTALSVPVLGLLLFAGGAGMGVLDSGVNVSLLWLYAGDKDTDSSESETDDAVPPAATTAAAAGSETKSHEEAGGAAESAMQALHFAFAAGAVLSPLGLQYATELHQADRNSTAGGISREDILDDGALGLPFYAPVFFAMGAVGLLIALCIFCTPSPPRPWERSAGRGAKAAGGTGRQEEATALAEAGHGLSGGAAAAVGSSDDDNAADGGPETGSASGASSRTAEGAGPAPVAIEVEMVAVSAVDIKHSAGSQQGSGQEEKSCACCFGGCGPYDFRRWVLIVILACMLGLYVGCEAGYGGFISTFARYKLGWSATRAQTLAAVFWAAVAVGRLVSVWVARCLSSELMICLAVGGSAASTVLLWVLLGRGAGGGVASLGGGMDDYVLWVLSAAVGLSMANVFPTAISLAEGYTEVEGRHATILIVGSAIGEMLLPYCIAVLTGNEVEGGEGGAGGSGQGLDGVDDDVGGPSVGTDGEPAAIFAVVALGCVAQLFLLSLAIWWGRRPVQGAAAT